LDELEVPHEWPPGDRRNIDEPALGRGEKPLEVADSIPPIPARVDPVIAQPTGVAPGANGVRMDPEEPGGLRYRKRRIDWTRNRCVRQNRLGRKCQVVGWSLPSSLFLPIGRRSCGFRRMGGSAGLVPRPRPTVRRYQSWDDYYSGSAAELSPAVLPRLVARRFARNRPLDEARLGIRVLRALLAGARAGA
jgi:hypothetical protein